MFDTLPATMARIDEYGVLILAPEEETVPEDSVHEQTVDLILGGLRARYADTEDIEVCGRLAWFPDRENTRVRLDPDVMVVRRPKGHRRSFRSWAEEGVVPALVIEVVSAKDTDSDYAQRLGRAREHGVTDVILISPFTAGGVRVEHLRPDPSDPTRFRTVATSIDRSAPIVAPVIDVRISGGDRLRVIDEVGEWPSPGEAINRMRAEAARAEQEAARAEQEAARAEQEAARAEQEAARAEQ